MSIMKFNSIKPEYNRLLFKVKSTPGDRLFTRPSHGIYTRPIPEGYYMNRNAAKKTNPVINFFKRMYDKMKAIIAEMKPDAETHGGMDIIHKDGGVEQVL